MKRNVMNSGSKGKKIKVLYIITNGTLGGAQVHLYDLISGLSEDIEAHVVMGEKLWLWEHLAKKAIDLYSIDSLTRPISLKKDFKTVLQLKKLIKEIQPDLIHCHSSKAGFLGRLVGKLSNVPVVFTAHGWAFTEGVPASKRLVYSFLERGAAFWTERIICVSDYDRSLGEKVMPENAHKLLTIHNGVKEAGKSRTGEETEKLVSKRLKIVMVARFSPPKDQLLVLRALALVKAKGIAVFVTFIGGGPGLTQAEALAKELKVEDCVCFLGEQELIHDFLASQDVFLLISRWEGLPLSILEAMQQGLPVIASNVGGVSEAVIDKETGILVSRDDLAGLVRAIETMCEKPDWRIAMGLRGQKRFVSFFQLSLMKKKTLSVYKKIYNRGQEKSDLTLLRRESE